MSLGSDVFGYIAGAISIAVTLYAIVYSLLPNTKVANLLNLVEETEALFQRFKDEGLCFHKDESYSASTVGRSLHECRLEADKYRATAICSPSLTDQCRLFFSLRRPISECSAIVTELRRIIVTDTERARARLKESGQLRNVDECHSAAPPSQRGNTWTSAMTLVAEPPKDKYPTAETEKTAHYSSSTLPLPACTPTRKRSLPVRALRSCRILIPKSWRRRWPKNY
ncbi:hypothetical protein PLICRDRAFT_170844 [Plicaturopsis crispa FD-325 SS-3]|nr:hypothetical protein PLICRDRAFT_170844 [Plicaturopsis crispa FD-325 SS-3]